jgi:hypothetical protein
MLPIAAAEPNTSRATPISAGLQRNGQVGEDSKAAEPPERRHGEGMQHRAMAGDRDPLAERSRIARQPARQSEQQTSQRDRAEDRHQHKGRAPAEMSADPGAKRDTQNRRHRHARGHQCDGPAASFGRCDGDRDCQRGRHAQAGTKRHQHAGRQQHCEGGRRDRQQIAGDEAAQRQREHESAIEVVERHREYWRTNRIGQGVGGDQLARRCQGNLQVRGDCRHQAGDHERLGADGKGGEGQPEHAHRRLPLFNEY